MCARSSSRLLVAALLLLGGLVGGETIVFHGGQRAIGATNVNIRDGHITFTYRGKDHRVELVRVASVFEDTQTPYCRVVRFRSYEYKRKDGYVLDLAFAQREERMREPLVRVFTLEQDERGERSVELYANVRIEDPTRTFGLDMINSEVYARRAWFLEIGDLLAWRIEAWGDGELRLLQEESLVDDLAADWWRTSEIRRPEKMTPIDLEPDERDHDPDDEVPPVDCQIQTARFRHSRDDRNAQFNLGYQVLSKAVDEVDLPTAKFYYVTEDQDDERTVHSHTWQGKPVRLVDGQYTANLECDLPDEVGLFAGGLSRDARTQRVIFWRVELRYGDVVVATRESQEERVRETLPQKWWE